MRFTSTARRGAAAAAVSGGRCARRCAHLQRGGRDRPDPCRAGDRRRSHRLCAVDLGDDRRHRAESSWNQRYLRSASALRRLCARSRRRTGEPQSKRAVLGLLREHRRRLVIQQLRRDEHPSGGRHRRGLGAFTDRRDNGDSAGELIRIDLRGVRRARPGRSGSRTRDHQAGRHEGICRAAGPAVAPAPASTVPSVTSPTVPPASVDHRRQ